MLMDQGYMKSFLKFLGYTLLAVVVFFVLLFTTQDEEEIENFFSMTNFTEQIYDYWDWKRYIEDFDDVKFTGYMEIYFTGDTTGLNLEPRYYQFFMENAYKEHFGDFTPFINFDNFDLMERDEKVRELYETVQDEQVMVNRIEINCKYFGFGPVLYKVIMRSGTVGAEGTVETTFINLGSAQMPKFRRSLEHGIDRELKSWAKRFYKIKANDEQLKELYKSVYQK
ncbi:hypothetical protein KQI52_08795 [bacterium]|nr:hypothetical protein [bacterium]